MSVYSEEEVDSEVIVYGGEVHSDSEEEGGGGGSALVSMKPERNNT